MTIGLGALTSTAGCGLRCRPHPLERFRSRANRRRRKRDSSFATLLIYEGQPPQYVAEQLGHSAATLLRDYARVWEDFDPSQRVSAEERSSASAVGYTAPKGPRARNAASAGAPERPLGRAAVFRKCSAMPDGPGTANNETAD
jgi:hypothetical protein